MKGSNGNIPSTIGDAMPEFSEKMREVLTHRQVSSRKLALPGAPVAC